MQKLTFSGHESFACKQFWLKKGYEFSLGQKNFSDDYAVVDLGVGKNMVAAVRYWGKAFGLLNDDDAPTDLSNYFFAAHGRDPYLEDLGTIWLLHYLLIKTNRASIYSLFFNEFKRERVDFSKEHLHSFLKRKCEEQTAYVYNANTMNTDINVFLRNYVKPGRNEKSEVEDDFSCIFLDLEIIREYTHLIENRPTTFFKIESGRRSNLPAQIFLYALMDRYRGQSTITLHELQLGQDSPGSIFALSPAGLFNKIEETVALYPQITYSETAGNQILQIKSELTAQNVLDDYYRQERG